MIETRADRYAPIHQSPVDPGVSIKITGTIGKHKALCHCPVSTLREWWPWLYQKHSNALSTIHTHLVEITITIHGDPLLGSTIFHFLRSCTNAQSDLSVAIRCASVMRQRLNQGYFDIALGYMVPWKDEKIELRYFQTLVPETVREIERIGYVCDNGCLHKISRVEIAHGLVSKTTVPSFTRVITRDDGGNELVFNRTVCVLMIAMHRPVSV